MENSKKIVVLDGYTLCAGELNFDALRAFGDVTVYDRAAQADVARLIGDAQIVLTNKAQITADVMAACPQMEYVGVTATGYNIVDVAEAKRRGIVVTNAPAYSTQAVAQHTFALLFYLYENLAYYDAYVKEEKYVNDKMFTHFSKTFHQLAGKTWGIIGLGAIGKRVAEIASVFGCKVQYFSTSGRNHDSQYQEVDLQTLLKTSDIVSIHAPLTDDTLHLIGEKELSQMKESAILINVGRGPIIVEKDLADALDRGIIAAAGIDVLDTEPMSEDNPLRHIKDSTKLLITPHIAWASVEARVRLMDIIYGQIKEFLEK